MGHTRCAEPCRGLYRMEHVGGNKIKQGMYDQSTVSKMYDCLFLCCVVSAILLVVLQCSVFRIPNPSAFGKCLVGEGEQMKNNHNIINRHLELNNIYMPLKKYKQTAKREIKRPK